MKKTAFMKINRLLWIICLSFAPAAAHATETFLVENGESRAEIIIAESPARSTRLAVADIQVTIAVGSSLVRCLTTWVSPDSSA